MKNKKQAAKSALVHITLAVMLFMTLYPLAMTLWGAMKSQTAFSSSQWYPTLPLYLSNLSYAAGKLLPYMANTIFTAAAGTAGMLFVASIAAYAFARMQFPGRSFLFAMVMTLMMVPAILTLVPSYMIYKSLIGLDNYAILIVPAIVGGPIGGVFLLRSFFEGLPESVFEAARIDGAGEFRSYLNICLPLSLPIMGTLAITQVSNAWNDYLWPMITIKNESLYTISIAILIKYQGSNLSNQPALYAGYLVSSIPLILLFVGANRYYIEGLSSSAMKL